MDPISRASRTRRSRRLISSRGLAVLLVSLSASPSWADDVLTLGSLLAHPESYHSTIVRVTGTVTSHMTNHFIGDTTKFDACIHQFTVKDETGTMKAVYATVCPGGQVMLRKGDRVTLDAHFEGKPGKARYLKVQSVVQKLVP